MEDEEYRMQIACKQVYTILNLYNRELLCLILPEEVLRKLKENSAKDYEYNINPNTFSPDDITEEASAILLIIFDKYFANQTQKDKINRFLNTQDNENFDYNLLFKNKKEKGVPHPGLYPGLCLGARSDPDLYHIHRTTGIFQHH